MANELEGFNATAEKSANVLPAGDYDLVITRCELKATSSGVYHQVAAEYQVMNGEFQNRKIFEHYTFAYLGPNQPTDNQKKAVQIGRGKFARVCEAVGVTAPKSCSDLVGKTLSGKVKIRKQDGFDDVNEITKASPRTPATASAAGPATPGKW